MKKLQDIQYELSEAFSPNKFSENGLLKGTYEELETRFWCLFNFTAGLLLGSNVSKEAIEELTKQIKSLTPHR